MDQLRAIATFVRAAELGSFNLAAVAQNTSPQAVSKTIRQLEQHLGVRLFHRTTRNSALTEEGRRLLESIKPSLDGVVGALSRARSAAHDDEGVLRIAAAGATGRKVLLPLIAPFQLDYPRVQFDLLLEDGFSDLVNDRIDVGFRAGNAPDAQVVARRLFPIQLIVCATPAYLQRHGAPRTLDALMGQRCIAYRQPGSGRPMAWEFDVDGDTVYRHVPAALLSSDTEAEMLAVINGIGIGQIDSINAAAAIRAGALVPLLVEHVSSRMGLYLYYAQRSDMPGRVRRFIDVAVERLRDSSAFCLSADELRRYAQSR